MNVAIDLGNTSVKLGFFTGNALLRTDTVTGEHEIIRLLEAMQPHRAIIGSVARDGAELRTVLQPYVATIRVVDSTTSLPFTVAYDTPHTLGADRVAAVAGAQMRYPNENVLVLDLGTCITYDFVDAQQRYQGGSISPGMHMRFRALHSFTARLPLVAPPLDVPFIGKSTHDAITSGVINGIRAEISGIIAQYRQNFGDLRVIFCGGDANFFESRIKETIFVVPELVLIGLNRILDYNALET